MGYPVHAHLEKEEYEELWQEQVKPWLQNFTCLWQVNGCLLLSPVWLFMEVCSVMFTFCPRLWEAWRDVMLFKVLRFVVDMQFQCCIFPVERTTGVVSFVLLLYTVLQTAVLEQGGASHGPLAPVLYPFASVFPSIGQVLLQQIHAAIKCISILLAFPSELG